MVMVMVLVQYLLELHWKLYGNYIGNEVKEGGKKEEDGGIEE